MQRPVGVTILAILYFLGAAFCIFGGLGFFLGGGVLASVLSQNSQLSGQLPAGFIAGMGAVMGVGMLIGAAIDALLGWGLWKLKNWARIVTIVLMGLGAIFLVFGLLSMLMHFNIFGLLWNCFWLAIYGVIIWYLLQPNVKAAFEGRRTMTATA